VALPFTVLPNSFPTRGCARVLRLRRVSISGIFQDRESGRGRPVKVLGLGTSRAERVRVRGVEQATPLVEFIHRSTPGLGLLRLLTNRSLHVAVVGCASKIPRCIRVSLGLLF